MSNLDGVQQRKFAARQAAKTPVDMVREPKYKVPQAAAYLGVSGKTIWNWLSARKLSCYRNGRSVLIGESELRRILEEGFTPAKSA